MIIYKFTNKIDGKDYIGQTTQSLEARVSQHFSDAKSGRRDYVIDRAIRKYGRENFIIEKWDDALSIDELNKMEIFWIKELNTLAPNGYNLLEGGKNAKHTEETKKKLSESRKGKKFGPHSEETKKKLSESHSNNKVKIICVETGIIYPSVKEAARTLKLNKSHIFGVLAGRRNHTGGLSFKRV